MAVGLVSGGIAPAAGAHDELEGALPASATEAEIREAETIMYGADHAAEHAALRAAQDAGALRQGSGRSALSSEGAPPLPSTGPPSEVGEWTEAPFRIPTFAIHSVLLPTGKVLIWGRPPGAGGGSPDVPNVGEAALWSPWLGRGADAFEDVEPPVIDVDGPGGPQPPGAAPFYCSGLSLLPNGDVLVAGGNLVFPNTSPDDDFTEFAGLPTVFTFDPFTEAWVQQQSMSMGRWYPSQVLLPDGRTVITGGYTEAAPGGVFNTSTEVFEPPAANGGQGSIGFEPSAEDGGTGLYPHLFSSGDDVVRLGPEQFLTAVLDTTTFTWDLSLADLGQTRLAGNAVRRPGSPAGSDEFTMVGGYQSIPGAGDTLQPATGTSETIDMTDPAPAFAPDAELNVPRANANTVLLPDGTMVEVGGGSGYKGDLGGYVTYDDGRARQVELFDPATDEWVLGPAQEEDRAYHSTALLLPDGRIFSAGDDVHPTLPGDLKSVTDTAEIYSPPYLFKGSRPEIDDAPTEINWGDEFGIVSDDPGIERAVLMAPSAVTHGVDMSQRHIELSVLEKVNDVGINALAPPSAAAAPPGWYMLFLLDSDGVPSVASWVRLDPAAPDQPVVSPVPLEHRLRPIRRVRLGSRSIIAGSANGPRGSVVKLRFGDGTSKTIAAGDFEVGHRYDERGRYRVRLIVADGVRDPESVERWALVKRKRPARAGSGRGSVAKAGVRQSSRGRRVPMHHRSRS